MKVVETITDLDPEKPNIKQITGISQLYNFQFHEDSIRMWKAFGIGEGKLYVVFFLYVENLSISMLQIISIFKYCMKPLNCTCMPNIKDLVSQHNDYMHLSS